MKIYLFLFVCLPLVLFSQNVLVHSHNDYLQKYPLKTALKHNVNSIEIDVAFFKEQIKVSHLNILLKSKPNFEDLYLKPLLTQKDSLQFVKYLLVDIKSGGDEILQKLNELIANYNEIFASRSDLDTNKIKVLISGNANRLSLVNNNTLNYLFVDGNLNVLPMSLDSDIIPLISVNFAKLNSFERETLIVNAHAQNKLVRFWNTPDNSKTWLKLIELGVDIIGVDHIENYYKFSKK